jgi:putative nucleotidyltransferase with HDIG domain
MASLKGFVTPRDVFFAMLSRLEVRLTAVGLNEERREAARRAGELLAGSDEAPDVFQDAIFLAGQVPLEEIARVLQAFPGPSRLLVQGDEAVEPVPREEDYLALLEPPSRKRPRVNPTQVLGKVRRLATLPESVQSALAVLEDPEVDVKKVADILGRDPAISSRVLIIANSAFFSVRGKVGSLRAALVNIGIKAVRHIILTATLLETMGQKDRAAVNSIWRHSSRTAAWAGNLGRRLRLPDPDEVFISGLLHDVGRLAILQYLPEYESLVRQRSARGENPLEAETAVLGMTHAEVGAYLSRLWKLPESTSEAIAYHHSSIVFLRALPAILPTTRSVHAACALAHLPSDPGRTAWLDSVEEEFLGCLGLTREDLGALAPKVHQDAREVAALVGV